jgi:hypothetical protein
LFTFFHKEREREERERIKRVRVRRVLFACFGEEECDDLLLLDAV